MTATASILQYLESTPAIASSRQSCFPVMNHTELAFKEGPGTLQRIWVVSLLLYQGGVQFPTVQAPPSWMAPAVCPWLPSRSNGEESEQQYIYPHSL